MPMSNYPNGFLNGVTIRGLPVLQTYSGKVFWVSNASAAALPGTATGADTGDGTFQRPFATIYYAVQQCTASRGDIIIVKPGHAETISNATTLLLSTAGVAIVGLGIGSLRPTLTFSTATTANVPVTAANVSLKNILFKANFADIASFMTATGTATPTDFTVENCEFRDTSSILNALTIITGNATANSMSGLWFCNNRISSLGTTAATTAIVLAEAADRVTIDGNYGNWAILNDTAAMLATGANNVTNFKFGNNVLYRPNTSSTGGSFISTSGTAWTGHCHDNRLWQLDNSAGIWIATGTKLGFHENYSPITGAADKSGLINPVAV